MATQYQTWLAQQQAKLATLQSKFYAMESPDSDDGGDTERWRAARAAVDTQKELISRVKDYQGTPYMGIYDPAYARETGADAQHGLFSPEYYAQNGVDVRDLGNGAKGVTLPAWDTISKQNAQWVEERQKPGMLEKISGMAPLLGMAALGGFALGPGLAGFGAAEGGLGAAGLTEGALAGEMGFLPGSFELGASSYGGSAASGLNAAAAEGLGAGLGGGGMGEDFFGDFFGDWMSDLSPVDLGEAVNPWSTDPSLADLGGNIGSEGMDWLDMLKKANSLKSLLPGGSGGDASSSSATGLLDKLFSSKGLGAGLALAPSIGAISYATSQDPFDLSKLESAYNSIDPNSLAMPYDIQTGKGRESLNSSLTQRGVMGSSFANQDLSSYDTLRGLGRQNLLTTGAGSQATIAKQILDAQIAQQKNKNDLYGRALLALSGGLGSKSVTDFFQP